MGRKFLVDIGFYFYYRGMRRVIGYMVTFTTYGTWLQGDERGYVKDGEVLDDNKALLDANKRAMKGRNVRFGARDKEIVRQAILNESRQMNQKVFAILVWSNHVHIVAENTDEPIGKVVGRYKAAATKALKEMRFGEKMWTKGYDKRFCYDEKALRRRIAYVNGHKEKSDMMQGKTRQCRKEITPCIAGKETPGSAGG